MYVAPLLSTVTTTVDAPTGVNVIVFCTSDALLVLKFPKPETVTFAELSATIEICLYSSPICPTPVVGATLINFSSIFYSQESNTDRKN